MFITFIRTILLYALLVASIRMMGKRQIGEMEPAEFVVTMLLANLAAGPMQDGALSMASGVVPILTVLALEMILAVLTMRSIAVRKLLCGKPAILICDGKIDQKALAENRVSTDELTEQLREKDVFDLRAVKYAIMETNGELSVMLYPEYRPASSKDAGIHARETYLPYTIISDGKLLRENLSLAGLDRAWLHGVLREQNASIRETFLLTVDRAGEMIFVKKERV